MTALCLMQKHKRKDQNYFSSKLEENAHPQNNLKFNYTQNKYVWALYTSQIELKASPLQTSSFCILKEAEHGEAFKQKFRIADVLKTYPKIK